MWIGVLWAGLRVAMWITHLGGKFRHGLLEKSLKIGGGMPTILGVNFGREFFRGGGLKPWGRKAEIFAGDNQLEDFAEKFAGNLLKFARPPKLKL